MVVVLGHFGPPVVDLSSRPQWEPEVIAIALMYLAAKLSKFEVKDWKNRTPDHKHWWDQYVQNLETDVLEGEREHCLNYLTMLT